MFAPNTNAYFFRILKRLNQWAQKWSCQRFGNLKNQHSLTLAQPLPVGFNDKRDSFTKIERAIHKILGQDEKAALSTQPGFYHFFNLRP